MLGGGGPAGLSAGTDNKRAANCQSSGGAPGVDDVQLTMGLCRAYHPRDADGWQVARMDRPLGHMGRNGFKSQAWVVGSDTVPCCRPHAVHC